jgi:hypothetical protein
MASQTWFANTLANTRPASAPLNAPTSTIERTLAETEPSVRGILSPWSGLCTICKSRFRAIKQSRITPLRGRETKALISIILHAKLANPNLFN